MVVAVKNHLPVFHEPKWGDTAFKHLQKGDWVMYLDRADPTMNGMVQIVDCDIVCWTYLDGLNHVPLDK